MIYEPKIEDFPYRVGDLLLWEPNTLEHLQRSGTYAVLVTKVKTTSDARLPYYDFVMYGIWRQISPAQEIPLEDIPGHVVHKKGSPPQSEAMMRHGIRSFEASLDIFRNVFTKLG